MHYQVGQIVEGVITGIQPYGAFVALDNKTTGLIHISEISDGFVKDVARYVKVNDRIKVKIIDFDEKNNPFSMISPTSKLEYVGMCS